MEIKKTPAGLEQSNKNILQPKNPATPPSKIKWSTPNH